MPRKIYRVLLRPGFSVKIYRHRILFWIGALSVSLAAILFARTTFYGSRIFSDIILYNQWIALLITPAAFAAISWLTRRIFVGAEGSGIPQSIAALSLPDAAEREKVLSLKVAFGKILLTSLGLCAGASIGREGPTVQIGAAIMHGLGRWLRMPIKGKEQALILAGGAAGVAAAFNTPLAGIVFAIEELSRSFESRTSGTVLTAVIVAGIGSTAILGNYSYFGHTDAGLTLMQAWRPILVCGVGCGLLGGVFARVLIGFSQGVGGRGGDLIRRYPIGFAALCGFGLAVVGILSGNMVYGTGYEQAKSVIEGSAAVDGFYGPMKMLATVLSYISGIPGGIFAPSLAVGAGIGADIAALFSDLPVGPIVILGMVAYFTGVVQAPITAVVIVMEMTDNQTLLIPLMATALVAFGVSRIVCPVSFYHALAQNFLKKSAIARTGVL